MREMSYDEAFDIAHRVLRVADKMQARSKRKPEIHMRVDDFEALKSAMMARATYDVVLPQDRNTLWGFDIFRDDSVPFGEVHVKTAEEVHDWVETPFQYAVIWAREVVQIGEGA